ncbi:MAG: carboxypeptidase-like regulatory domain-containing protein [Armatimonadota bacterium]
MSRRLAALACLLFSVTGLLVALGSVPQLMRFPLERLKEMDQGPLPLAAVWLEGLRPTVQLLGRAERLLTGLLALALIGAFTVLAYQLNPAFHLLKPPKERVGKGLSVHIDVPRLIRAGLALVISVWLAGCLAPLAALFGPNPAGGAEVGAGTRAAWLLLGGIPAWTAGISGVMGAVVHSLLLFLALWLIWGPGGLVTPGRELLTHATPVWGVLAGLAGFPAILALADGRPWMILTGSAISLADPRSWKILLALWLLAPVAAGAYLGLHVMLFRPRPLQGRALSIGALCATALLLLGALVAGKARAAMAALDVEALSLASTLRLQPSPLMRFVYVLAPDGNIYPGSAEDGSNSGPRDRIAATKETILEVERFLEERSYNTALAFRAFWHLHDCASLDWLSTRSLEVDLKMLERAPSQMAADLLLEKLADCPITPENRKVLDALADPERFRWPQPHGARWLSAAYLRFGERELAREFLGRSELNREQLAQALGGITPLTDGKVRGRLTLDGRRIEFVRLGLINVTKWRRIVGTRRPFQWRHVSAMTHTDAEGRFEFTDLPQGRYVLVVTGGGIGQKTWQPVADRHPGVIQLDRFYPVHELGPINIRYVEPVRPPRNTDLGTLA